MKNQQVVFIKSFISLISSITRPIYRVILILLVGLLPSKKLRPSAPIEPTNIEHNHKSFFISTEELMERSRKVLELNPDPKSKVNLWIDKMEYLQEIQRLKFLVDYDFILSSADPREGLDYEHMEDWYLEQELKPIREQQAKTQQEVLLQIEVHSAYIPTLSYISLEYWPYDFC